MFDFGLFFLKTPRFFIIPCLFIFFVTLKSEAAMPPLTLTPPANTGDITNDSLYINVRSADGISGVVRRVSIKTLNQTKGSTYLSLGSASTITNSLPATSIVSKVIGGNATGLGSVLSPDIEYINGNANYVYSNPAPTWMGNIIVGACNNPESIVGPNGEMTSICPTDENGFITSDTDHFFGFFCGATLINDDWLLTAAHCVSGLEDQSGNPLTVAFVSAQIDDTSYTLTPQNTQIHHSGSGLIQQYQAYRDYADLLLVHPSFNGDVTAGYDLALIRLTTPLITGARAIPVSPVEINSQTSISDSYAMGAPLAVYGWGVTDSTLNLSGITQADLSTYLMAGTVPFSSASSDTNIIWAGGDGADTCVGDSGGPLMFNGLQVGITSFGFGYYCGTGTASAYTDIGSHYSWIRNTVNENAKIASSCFDGADCYVDGELVGDGATADVIDKDTVSNNSSSTSGGGSMGVEYILLGAVGAYMRRRVKKT